MIGRGGLRDQLQALAGRLFLPGHHACSLHGRVLRNVNGFKEERMVGGAVRECEVMRLYRVLGGKVRSLEGGTPKHAQSRNGGKM